MTFPGVFKRHSDMMGFVVAMSLNCCNLMDKSGDILYLSCQQIPLEDQRQ